MKVQKSIDINVAPDKVWQFLVKPEKILQWCITFKKFEYAGEQRSGIGTPLFIEEDAGNGLMKMQFEVSEWKENEMIALRMISGASLKAYIQEWRIESIPSGSRFTYMEALTFPMGVLGKLIGFFAEKMSARTIDKMLSKLKVLTEI